MRRAHCLPAQAGLFQSELTGRNTTQCTRPSMKVLYEDKLRPDVVKSPLIKRTITQPERTRGPVASLGSGRAVPDDVCRA